MMRAALATALVLGAFPLAAQSWDLLNGLKAGDPIKVRDASKQTHVGVFASVTPQSIRLHSRKGDVSIEQARVRRIEIRSGSRRVVNAAIGAGIGLAVGVVVDQSLGKLFRNETGQDSGQRAITYIAPIGLFGGLAAAFPAYRSIYRAP